MGKDGVSSISRKRFLQQVTMGLGAVGTGLILPGSLPAQLQISGKTKAPKKVLVLGVGLAGLAAAWELNETGHDVTALEARTRPGGRVSTVREPFAGDLYAEEGAVAFSGAYTHAIRYIEELGLERTPWSMPELPVVYHLNGKRFTVTPGKKVQWPYEMTPEEQKLGPMGIVKKYIIDTLPPEVSDPDSWDQPPLVQFDKMSLAEYMHSKGASEGAVKLIQNTQYFGAVPDRTSALSIAVSDFGMFMSAAPFVLAGGNDKLPRGMAEHLKKDIRYGVEVTAVKETNDSIEVTGIVEGSSVNFTGDRAVCTLPAPVLRNIRFEPSLPNDTSNAIEKLPYLNMTRTYLQIDQPFWHNEGIAGTAFTDLSIGQVSSYTGSEGGAILESYAVGPSALDLAELSDDELITHTIQKMEKVYPAIQEHYQSGYVKAWSKDPYALGGPSWPAHGDVVQHLKPLQKSHGRIHFAGEHTSILRSTMEGALRSGTRAAQEVHET